MPRKRKQRGKRSYAGKAKRRKLRKVVRRRVIRKVRKARRSRPSRRPMQQLAESIEPEAWKRLREVEKVTWGRRFRHEGRYWVQTLDPKGRTLAIVPWRKGIAGTVQEALKLEQGETTPRLRRKLKLDALPGFKLHHFDAAYGEVIWRRPMWRGSAEGEWEVHQALRMKGWRDRVFRLVPKRLLKGRESAFAIRLKWRRGEDTGWVQSDVMMFYDAARIKMWYNLLDEVFKRLNLAGKSESGLGGAEIIAADVLVSAAV